HEVVAESADTIVDAAVAGGRLLLHSLHNASSRLELLDLDGGNRRELALPAIGAIVGLAARWRDTRAYLTFMSFITPPQIFQVDAMTGVVSRDDRTGLSSLATTMAAVESSEYITEQV